MRVGKLNITWGQGARRGCLHTEAEVSKMLASLLGDVDSLDITKEETQKILSEVGAVEGYLEVLRDTMVNDIKRYFSAQNERERDIIRGGFSRTAYLRSSIIDNSK